MRGRVLGDGYFTVPPGKLAAVVTSLRMLEPPARPAGPRPGLRLRRETAAAPAWYRDLFRRIGEPYLWSSRLSMSDAILSAILHDPAVELHVLERAGAAAGLAELDFRQRGFCEINFFGLVPDHTGQGLGPWMMSAALEHAWARRVTGVWLHTCTLDHPGALAFYKRCGFVPFRRQVEILDDPRALGLLSPAAAPEVPRL